MEGFLKFVLVVALIAVVIILFPAIVGAIVWIYGWLIKVKLTTWLIILIVAIIAYLIWG